MGYNKNTFVYVGGSQLKAYRIFTNEHVKKLNSATIMQIVNEYGPISKIEIARLTGLNPATVTNAVKVLLEENFVKIVGEDKSSGGRKPTLLALNDEYYFSIGVNLGMSEISFAAINLKGDLIAKMVLPLDDMAYLFDLVNVIDENIRRLKKLCMRSFKKLYAIGLTTDGMIDTEKGLLIDSPYYKWNRLNIKYIFENAFKEKIFFDTRARAMTVAEKIYGYGKNCGNLVAVDIADQISVGILANHRLINGNNYGAGEIGHIRVSNRNKCTCGKTGCLRTFITDDSLEKRFNDHIKNGETSILLDEYEIEDIKASHIYVGADRGDKVCDQIVRETGKYIGRGLSYLVNIVNPEMIFISGAYSATNVMNREINKGIADYSYNKNLNQVYIGESSFRENAEIMGAGSLGFKEVFFYE
jgi:predicted NBD/HSP70 family sugar kinase